MDRTGEKWRLLWVHPDYIIGWTEGSVYETDNIGQLIDNDGDVRYTPEIYMETDDEYIDVYQWERVELIVLGGE